MTWKQIEEGMRILDEVVKENEHVTPERVKRFLRENGIALAGVGIMLASFITAVVSIVKSGVRRVKTVTSEVGKVFKEIAKKLGPILGPIFSPVGTLFSLFGKSASWLASNLWVLLLLILYFLYDFGKWKLGKK